MKRILTILAAFACLCSCETLDHTGTFETDVQKLYDDYTLTDIHWSGLAVNLNQDNYGFWALFNEFKNKIGYYEPDYTATVNNGIIYNSDMEWAEYAAAFHVVLPYPHHVVSDGKWICDEIRNIRLTIRATEDDFQLYQNCCHIIPGYGGKEDVFLAGIQDISLYIESYDARSFKVGLHCTLPYNESNGAQRLNTDYLYYTFTR